MKKTITFTALMATLSLIGCGSVESDLKLFMKCGIAAKQLERDDASQKISIKMSAYIEEKKINGSAGYAIELGQEVREDLGLYDKNPQGQMYVLVKAFNSSECQKIHEKESINMPFSYYLSYFFI